MWWWLDAENGNIFFDAPNWGEEQKCLQEGTQREVHFPAEMLGSK